MVESTAYTPKGEGTSVVVNNLQSDIPEIAVGADEENDAEEQAFPEKWKQALAFVKHVEKNLKYLESDECVRLLRHLIHFD